MLLYFEPQITVDLAIFPSNSDLIENNSFVPFIFWSTGIASFFSSPPFPPVLASSIFLPACCLLGSPLLSLTTCDMLFSHTGWVRNPGREGGQRREGRARMYFPERTFLWLLCSAVINRRSSPAGSAGCGGDRWDERTESESRRREVSYTIITSVCAARVSISVEARRRGGRCSGWIIPILLRLIFSPFLSPRRICLKRSSLYFSGLTFWNATNHLILKNVQHSQAANHRPTWGAGC